VGDRNWLDRVPVILSRTVEPHRRRAARPFGRRRALECGAQGALADGTEGVPDLADRLAREAEGDGFVADLGGSRKGSHI